jgi:hypothetical protein
MSTWACKSGAAMTSNLLAGGFRGDESGLSAARAPAGGRALEQEDRGAQHAHRQPGQRQRAPGGKGRGEEDDDGGDQPGQRADRDNRPRIQQESW